MFLFLGLPWTYARTFNKLFDKSVILQESSAQSILPFFQNMVYARAKVHNSVTNSTEIDWSIENGLVFQVTLQLTPNLSKFAIDILRDHFLILRILNSLKVLF